VTKTAAARVRLLDVNVLVALFVPAHVHHDIAHDWFAVHQDEGWATCPLTENGFVRVVLNLPGRDERLRAATVLEHFRTFCAAGGHHFWREDVSIRDARVFDPSFITGPRQLTDIYLLGLARTMGGRLVSFDRSIPCKAVRGAPDDLLEVIAG